MKPAQLADQGTEGARVSPEWKPPGSAGKDPLEPLFLAVGQE